MPLTKPEIFAIIVVALAALTIAALGIVYVTDKKNCAVCEDCGTCPDGQGHCKECDPCPPNVGDPTQSEIESMYRANVLENFDIQEGMGCTGAAATHNDIGGSVHAPAVACAALCDMDAACTMFYYNSTDGNCSLSSTCTADTLEPNAHFDSYIKS